MTSTLSELAPGRAGLLTVSVFGLGYVGCVSAACLAARGHAVVGVDANRDKIEFLRQGQSPVVEERIGELTAEVVGAGRLTVTADPAEAVLGSDVSIVCVGTPSASGGGLSTRYLESVSEEIGEALASKDGWHVVVFRSTMVPGTCREHSCSNPGTSLRKASRHRLRGVCQPGIPEGRHQRLGFREPAEDGCRRKRRAQRSRCDEPVRRSYRTAFSGADRSG